MLAWPHFTLTHSTVIEKLLVSMQASEIATVVCAITASFLQLFLLVKVYYKLKRKFVRRELLMAFVVIASFLQASINAVGILARSYHCAFHLVVRFRKLNPSLLYHTCRD